MYKIINRRKSCRVGFAICKRNKKRYFTIFADGKLLFVNYIYLSFVGLDLVVGNLKVDC